MNTDKNTVQEFVKMHQDIEKLNSDLEAEKQSRFARLVEIQKLEIAGKKPDGKEYREIKDRLQDIDLKIEAAKETLKDLKRSLVDRIPIERDEKIKMLDQDRTSALAEKKKLEAKLDDLMAQCVVYQEFIDGPGFRFASQGIDLDNRPSLNRLFDEYAPIIFSQKIERYSAFIQKALEYRGSIKSTYNKPIDQLMRDLGREIERLENLDVESELARLLTPETETAIPAEPVEQTV